MSVGRPFQKGQSGNPGGKPSQYGMAALIRKATKDGALAVDFFLDLANGKIDGKRDRCRVTTNHRITAWEWLIERGFGKPVQTTEHIGAPVVVFKFDEGDSDE